VTAESSSITLHSSWRHLLASSLGAGLIAVGGTYGVVAAGFTGISTVLFVLGWGAVAIVLFDVPVASTFTATGVERRMVLRRQLLVWREGDELTRARPSLLRLDRSLQHGGLVLRRGKRRYLLVDRAENAAEFDVLVRLIETPGEGCVALESSMLPRPAETTPPTWLYRRRRWRPDAAPDR
jgi:hypothetical protein